MDQKLKIISMCLIMLLAIGIVSAAEAGEGGEISDDSRWKIAIAAALAIGAAAIASAYGIAHAGSAAMAAMAEKPEVATWGVIIVALAEGLALYGLVIAFMIIGKI